MKKDELEAELAKCVRSRAWYRGQYERLREADGLQVEEIELLRERCTAYEKEIRRGKLQRTREEQQAEKDRQRRQAEIARQQEEARTRAAHVSEEPEDEDEARLFRCQRENARLRTVIEGLQTKLKMTHDSAPEQGQII